jgi:type IV secretion system protein TrbL
MAAPPGSILPSSYFDGLSSLWGGCAYIGSAIVAAGLVVQTVRSRPDAGIFVWLLAKVLFIGIATLFLREWLMRLNDIVFAFAEMLGVDPTAVDERFVEFIAGKTSTEPNASIWDVIWGTKSIGTAITYAFLWLFGWLSWGVQYVVKLIGGVLLTAGWALSPIFLSFFMLRPMAGVAQKYIIGLVALVCWPFGWVIAAVVTNAMLDAAATASLVPVIVVGAPVAGPALTVLLIGAWMLVSAVLAPYVTTKILLMGANPAAAFAQGVGGVAQAVFAGGVGAGVAAATGGVGAAGVVAAAAAGAMAGGTESAARGGGSARTTSTAIGGLSGFYAGSYMKRHVAASEAAASARQRQAEASEAFTSEFSRHAQDQRQSRSGFDQQPHTDDPNQAAIDIESYDSSKPNDSAKS